MDTHSPHQSPEQNEQGFATLQSQLTKLVDGTNGLESDILDVTNLPSASQLRRSLTAYTNIARDCLAECQKLCALKQDQRILQLERDLSSEKRNVATLNQTIARLEVQATAHRSEQTKLYALLSAKDQDLDDYRSDFSENFHTISAKDRDINYYKSEVVRLQESIACQRPAEQFRKSHVERLKTTLATAYEKMDQMYEEHHAQLHQIHDSTEQTKRASKNLWAIVMKDLWKQDYGEVPLPTLVHWATLRPAHWRPIDEAFPPYLTPIPESGFHWTLSICSLAEMSRYRNTNFSQLVVRLTLVLPLHEKHSTALPILETMLHSIRDSRLEDLLSLETLLMAVWKTLTYVQSDDHDICDCRLVEVIVRCAHHHRRYWASLGSATARWNAGSDAERSIIVLAYRSWVWDIEYSRVERRDDVMSLPTHLYMLTTLCESSQVDRRRHGVWVNEHLLVGDHSKPRTLLAGDLFPNIRAYFLYDLSKQEAMMFRTEEAHYSVGTGVLTLPERFGHHHIGGNMINPGYTTDLNGTFQTPKPVVLREFLFVCKHMPELFDASS